MNNESYSPVGFIPEPDGAEYMMNSARMDKLSDDAYLGVLLHAAVMKTDWENLTKSDVIGFVVDTDYMRNTFRVYPVCMVGDLAYAYSYTPSSVASWHVNMSASNFIRF